VIAFGRFVQPPRPAMGPPPAPAAPAEPAPAPVAATTPPGGSVESPQAAIVPAAAVTGATPWKVAPGSTLAFTSSWGGEPIQGRFDKWHADVLFGPDALDTSKVTVSIDMTSAKTGDEQRDASLPSGDWFDAATHPNAVFTATKFAKTGADRYVAHGALSLRGVTRPLDLPFKLTISGDRAKVTGEASLNRTVFGVGQGEFTATDQVPGKVTVRVDLSATRDRR
jgi:polyisoprenoid-binding protein YceI